MFDSQAQFIDQIPLNESYSRIESVSFGGSSSDSQSSDNILLFFKNKGALAQLTVPSKQSSNQLVLLLESETQ